MPNLTDPKLYVFDTQDNTVNEINVPDHVYPAQPKFRPNTNSLVFVGFKKTPYKLGINVMLNRGTQLFHLDVVSKEIEEIALPDSCVAGLYPKFNSSGNQFAYFGVPKGKRSHVMCLTLNVTEWETKQSRCLVDVVEDFNEDFNGIYGYHDTLSGFNWLSDDNIIFDTPHKGSRCIFTADLNGRIKEYVHNLQKPYDLALLDIYNGSALIKASNPLNFPKILTAHLVNEEWITTQLDDLTPTPLTPEEQQIMDTLSRTNLTTLKHKNSDMTSFLIHTAPTNPLFIIPHGGPHSSAFTDLTFVLCARLALGYNVLLPNYRGSIGYGSKNVEALLTHVGDMDVEDCIESIEMAKEHVSTHFVIAYGGSHGGFLSAHLATRGVPNLSIVANGVADISSMSLVSDITDWCFAEVFNTDPVYPPTPAQITEMYRMSPLSKSGNIDIPVMIVAGGADKRVPPQASMQLYRVLKANGVDVKLLWYENDGHSLLTKSTAYDFIVNQLLWVEEKMKSENKSI